MTRNPSEYLPNLVLPGFPKCGTTSVAETLASHPDVVGAFPHRATHYFTPRLYDPSAPLRPIEKYAEHFAHCSGEGIRLDDTVVWAYGGVRMAETIASCLNAPKALIMLREPTARTVSYLTWKKRNVEIPQDVTLVEYIERCEELGPRTVDTKELNPWSGLYGSDYHRYLPGWVEIFGDKLRVGFMEDLRDRPLEFYSAMADWLGIDPEYFGRSVVKVANPARSVRSPLVERVVRAVGRNVQPLARRAPAIYGPLRDVARKVNMRDVESTTDEDDALSTLGRRFAADQQVLRDLVEERTLLGAPEWLLQTAPSVG